MLGYRQIEECIENKTVVWGYGFIPATSYELRPTLLRKPEKGIIEYDESCGYYSSYCRFIPLNKQGKPIKSRSVLRTNMRFAYTEEDAIKDYNDIIERHLKIITDSYKKVSEYKI